MISLCSASLKKFQQVLQDFTPISYSRWKGRENPFPAKVRCLQHNAGAIPDRGRASCARSPGSRASEGESGQGRPVEELTERFRTTFRSRQQQGTGLPHSPTSLTEPRLRAGGQASRSSASARRHRVLPLGRTTTPFLGLMPPVTTSRRSRRGVRPCLLPQIVPGSRIQTALQVLSLVAYSVWKGRVNPFPVSPMLPATTRAQP